MNVQKAIAQKEIEAHDKAACDSPENKHFQGKEDHFSQLKLAGVKKVGIEIEIEIGEYPDKQDQDSCLYQTMCKPSQPGIPQLMGLGVGKNDIADDHRKKQ